MPDKSAFKGYRDDQIGVGSEGNSSQVNEPGVYFDPQSDKELEVFHPAAADALVRMGWLKCEVERDDEGKITKVIRPKAYSHRDKDTEEIEALKAKLAQAEAIIKNKESSGGKPEAQKDSKK